MIVAALQWSFHDGWFAAGLVLFALLVAVTLRHLQARRWPLAQSFWEAFRLLLAGIILLALARPESLQETSPPRPATILFLTDHSASMETEDMPGADPSQKISRLQWLRERQDLWSASLPPGTNAEHGAFASDTLQTNLHAALTDVLERSVRPHAVVLLSDGDANAGPPPSEAALNWRRQGLPLITVPVGNTQTLPDLALRWLPMPTTLVTGEPARLPFQVHNRFSQPLQIELRFQAGDPGTTDQERRTIDLAPGQQREDAFLWTPPLDGESTLTISSPVLPGETRSENNTDTITITAGRDQIRVLLIDSAPRWEFRYLRNALMRDPGVELSAVLFHPQPELGLGQGPAYLDAFPDSLQALTEYDVIFLGDVGVGPGNLSDEQAGWIRGLVERQASGLVFLPGSLGRQQHQAFLDSPLGELLPIVWEDDAPAAGYRSPHPAALELTPSGRQSVLTLLTEDQKENALVWRSLPGFPWHAPVARAKAGATVLAVHESSRNTYGRLPLLVTRPFGSGKVLFLGTDGVWRWRRGVEDRYHYRFWSQVARWMAYQRNLAENDRGRLFVYPDAPRAGRQMVVHATFLDDQHGPITGATPVLTWNRDDIPRENLTTSTDENVDGRLTLTEIEGEWGVYRGTWTPPAGGAYQLSAALPQESWSLQRTVDVAEPPREPVGDPARPERLRDLAAAAGGSFLPRDDLDQLPDLLQSLAPLRPVIHRHPWWRDPRWLGGLLIGFAAFWWMRRRLGLV